MKIYLEWLGLDILGLDILGLDILGMTQNENKFLNDGCYQLLAVLLLLTKLSCSQLTAH